MKSNPKISILLSNCLANLFLTFCCFVYCLSDKIIEIDLVFFKFEFPETQYPIGCKNLNLSSNLIVLDYV